MDDDQKWLEAAAAIEQDIHYLKAAMGQGKRNGIPCGLEQEILQLKVVLGVYRKNAAHGVVFPHPDDLYCISALPHGAQAASTGIPSRLQDSFTLKVNLREISHAKA